LKYVPSISYILSETRILDKFLTNLCEFCVSQLQVGRSTMLLSRIYGGKYMGVTEFLAFRHGVLKNLFRRKVIFSDLEMITN